jgi:hypothetical protein
MVMILKLSGNKNRYFKKSKYKTKPPEISKTVKELNNRVESHFKIGKKSTSDYRKWKPKLNIKTK